MRKRITVSIVDVLDSLTGTPDYEVLHGVTPAAVTHWDLAELLGSGISLNGINRVLSKAKVKRVSVGKEKPCLPARVFFEQLRDLCDGVLSLIDLPGGTCDGQSNHGSSSVDVTVSASDLTEVVDRLHELGALPFSSLAFELEAPTYSTEEVGE